MVAQERKHIDISNLPELSRIAEEVRETREPHVLRQGDEDVAVIMPIKQPRKRLSEEERRARAYEAFRSSAGAWQGLVDGEKLKADIYAARGHSDRLPPEE